MNQYGFASSDPVNGSDPFGLKVCFGGPKAEVDSAKSATEEATATTISLDEKNCIIGVTPVDKASGLTELGRRLATMAGAPGEEWYIQMWPLVLGQREGGYSFGSSNWGYALLGRWDQTDFFTGPWGQCDGGTEKIGMAGMIAHELLGHLWRVRGGGSLRDDAAENYSTQTENLYRSMPGKGPERCKY